MQTYKVSFWWLGLVSVLTLGCALYVQVFFNQSGGFDFYINVLIGVFGSSLVSALFVLISYFVEHQRLVNEMAKSFALSMVSLNQCCMADKKKPMYKIKMFGEWKSHFINFFQFRMQFAPFWSNMGKARKINELSHLLTSLGEKLIGKEYHLETADLEEKAISKIFNDIVTIKDDYKERINNLLNIFYPGVSLK
jgi:hypothetical protein